MMEIIQWIITGLSIVGGILAWVAKIMWSKEFTAAKDATIESLRQQITQREAQIEELRHWTPMKMREYYLSSKEQYEEMIVALNGQITVARQVIQNKDQSIIELKATSTKDKNRIEKLEAERNSLAHNVDELQAKVAQLPNPNKAFESAIKDFELPKLPELSLSLFDSSEAVNKALQEMTFKPDDPFKKLIEEHNRVMKKAGENYMKVFGEAFKESLSLPPIAGSFGTSTDDEDEGTPQYKSK